MKIFYAFLLLLLFHSAAAQQIRITDEAKQPVTQAVVVIKPLSGGKETILLTDNRGMAVMPAFSGAHLIMVSHLAYEIYRDTLSGMSNNLIISIKPKNIRLDEVVVTAEYRPRTAGESVHPVKVINRKAIQTMAATDLAQVLDRELSMRVSQNMILGQGLSMNGMSGQNIKILMDGVPVTGRMDGNIDLGQLNMSTVERIEVVNGPMAAGFGTDAAGGVVNIITRQSPSNHYETGLNLMYETVGWYNADFLAGYRSGKKSVLLNGGRNFFDGWSPQDTGRVELWKPKEQYFGQMNLNYVLPEMIFSYRINGMHETVFNKGEPRLSPYFAYAFDENYKTLRFSNQLNHAYIITDRHTLNTTLSHSLYQRTKNTFRKDLVTLEETEVSGSGSNDTTLMNTWTAKSVFSSSDHKKRVSYQAGIDLTYEYATGTRFINERISTGDYAFFAGAEYRVTSKIEIKPSVRYGYNTSYSQPLIPSLMIRYGWTPSLTTRLSYGKGFRAPGIKERYLYFVDVNHNIRGNEDLLPESSHHFFLNVNHHIRKGSWDLNSDLNGFYSDISNLITLAQPDLSSSLYTYVNIGEYSTHGGSLSAEVARGQWSLLAGYSYTGRYNSLSWMENVGAYLYSPDANARIRYELARMGLSISVNAKYNGKQPVYIINQDGSISQSINEAYTFVDVSLQKSFFSKALTIVTGVRNLTEVTSVNAAVQGSAHSGGSGSLPVGTGRSGFIKLQYLLSR